jgi:hypothetical protein
VYTGRTLDRNASANGGWASFFTGVGTSGEGVADLDSPEASEVAVVRPEGPNLVLEHQRDEVRIRHQVARRCRVVSDGPVPSPELGLFARRPDVRAVEEGFDVRDRIRCRQGLREDGGMRRDPQVAMIVGQKR